MFTWLFDTLVLIFTKGLVPILVLGALIFVHELGHFLVAKWCGVGVLRFALGFGPVLFRFRRNETEYQLRAIPLGGFVRMVGDMPDFLTGEQVTDKSVSGEENLSTIDSAELEYPAVKAAVYDRNRWFVEKNLFHRSAIVFAGPLFNYLFALIVVFVAVLLYGEESIDESPRLGSIMEGSPAAVAGLKVGDLILEANSQNPENWTQLAELVHNSGGEPISFKVQRGGEQLSFRVKAQERELRGFDGEKKRAHFIGITPGVTRQDSDFLSSISFSFRWSYERTKLTLSGLVGMLVGKVSPKDLAGPLFIVEAAGKQADHGFDNVLYFMALLSVSLAVLNLLPIPVLDGGHLLFFFIEALIGPLSIRKKELAQQVGLLLLLGLTVFAVHNDITREEEKGLEWKSAEQKTNTDAPPINNETTPQQHQ